MITITTAKQQDYPRLLTLWEASVRATHHFITEQTITELKPLIIDEYLPALTVICSQDQDNNQHITGFAGVCDNKLEMLFIDPKSRGQGIGKALLQYVIEHLKVNSVDVNEQNPQAVGFYLHQGFKIIGRSALDGQNNPYPILHLSM